MMTPEERWQFVLDERRKVMNKSTKTTQEKNFLEVFDLYVKETEMPAEGMVYFMYSTAKHLKKSLW